MKLLYVDGELVDLYPTTVIAQTLQVFDPGRIGSILTTYTNNLKVPRTKTNDRIFRHLANPKVKSDVPYSSLSCEYFENGIPVIRNGRIVLNESNEKEYVFTIYAGAWGFFERIQGKTLWDLDFSGVNGPWTQSARDGYRNATSGVVAPLFSDGTDLDADLSGDIEYTGAYNRTPCLYYHTIIEKIFSTFGFEATGDILDDAVFKNLAVPCSVQYRDPSFIESRSFYAGAPGDQEILNPTTAQAVMFTQNVRQGSAGYYDGVSKYIVSNPDTASDFLRIRVQAEITIQVVGGTVDIYVARNGAPPSVIAISGVGSGTYTPFLSPSDGFADGDQMEVMIETSSGTPVISVLYGVFRTGAKVEDSPEQGSFLANFGQDYVYFNKLLEEFDLTEFLKEFCILFNVQITQINNVLHVNTTNKILDTLTGPDWTLKRIKGPDRIKYTFASYGQRNLIKFPIDEQATPDITEENGTGYFDIPNENLLESVTIHTSKFYAGDMITEQGVFMYRMVLKENDVTPRFLRAPGNRLFFLREAYTHEPGVIYNSTARSDYLVAYAWDPDQSRFIGWQFFIDNYHAKFVDRCLRRVRFIERQYILSDLDMLKFNQQVPIFDGEERFLVTRIINRVPKKACKVELLKIEANPANTFDQNYNPIITGALEDTMEFISDNINPSLLVELELQENVAGNPTWQCTFNNGDTEVIMVVGDEASDDGTLDHEGKLNVATTVVKTNNDGNGPDGFPVTTGYVEWLRNGTRVNTKQFDSSSSSAAQDLTYTYPDVKAWEQLKVIVFEDGSTP